MISVFKDAASGITYDAVGRHGAYEAPKFDMRPREVWTVDERGEDESKVRIERNKGRYRISSTHDGSLTRLGVEKLKRGEEVERARRVSSQESEALLDSELNCSELRTFVIFGYSYRR